MYFSVNFKITSQLSGEFFHGVKSNCQGLFSWVFSRCLDETCVLWCSDDRYFNIIVSLFGGINSTLKNLFDCCDSFIGLNFDWKLSHSLQNRCFEPSFDFIKQFSLDFFVFDSKLLNLFFMTTIIRENTAW